MSDAEIISMLGQQQDRESEVGLLRAAIGRESVTGNENNFADLLVSTLTDMDLSPNTGEFLPDL